MIKLQGLSRIRMSMEVWRIACNVWQRRNDFQEELVAEEVVILAAVTPGMIDFHFGSGCRIPVLYRSPWKFQSPKDIKHNR